MKVRTIKYALAATGALLASAVGSAVQAAPPAGVPYEVWITDQNSTAGYNPATPRGTHGGKLIIHGSSALEHPSGPRDEPEVIDLAIRYAVDGPNNATGVNVVRPHMLDTSPNGRYVVLSFVGSGHVAILDAVTHASKALFRMSAGTAGARQAHAAFWTQDGSAIVVANQNGKLLERIDYDAATDTFVHNAAATINLATCQTPSGLACQTATPLSDLDPAYLGANNRPDNAPICPITTKRGHTMVTLRGGGMFVVDPSATPMQIVAAYGNETMGRDGCGGRQDGPNIYLNAGTGTTATNPHEFSLYNLKDNFPRAPRTLPDNETNHGPRVFYRADGAHHDQDAHGMVVTQHKGVIWQFDRMGNVVELFDAKQLTHLGTVSLLGGPSADPTPDIVQISPDGRRIYAALRGPKPQTGAHASAGSTPGLGIVEVDEGDRSGRLAHVLPTSIINPVDGSQESDPHGIVVVPTR